MENLNISDDDYDLDVEFVEDALNSSYCANRLNSNSIIELNNIRSIPNTTYEIKTFYDENFTSI